MVTYSKSQRPIRIVLITFAALMLVAVVVLVVGGAFKAKYILDEKTAFIDTLTIRISLEAYYRHVGKYPAGAIYKGDTYLRSDDIVPILLGETSHENPERLAFMVLESGDNAPILDPWGRPYSVVVDSDGDGNCDTKEFGRIVGQAIVVWSSGSGPIGSWGPPRLTNPPWNTSPDDEKTSR